ncbi:hypothetical protein ACFYY1_12845 [Streptomyces sp. NPDC001890]|uniref:hypothetical protein n=1 Tax=Streptomyces sp. NPDC001890 TaxID=3364620 RepID=UPI00369F5601
MNTADMNTVDMNIAGRDIAEVQRQLRALTDRAEITDLMDRCLRSLDEGAA